MGLGDTCTTSASDVGGRRLATVVAMENTMLIKLTRDAWLGIEKRWEIYEHHLIENTLRASPLFIDEPGYASAAAANSSRERVRAWVRLKTWAIPPHVSTFISAMLKARLARTAP